MSLQDDIVELLTQAGPLEPEFLHIRLCVASRVRMQAALLVLREEGRIERVGHEGRVHRIPGDKRLPGAGDIHNAKRLKRQRALATAS